MSDIHNRSGFLMIVMIIVYNCTCCFFHTVFFLMLVRFFFFSKLMLFCLMNCFHFVLKYFYLLLLCLTCLRSIYWQSYVLDVHPFNPRIAMSAGYDGQTIIWDVSFCCLFWFIVLLLLILYRVTLSLSFQIWEGTPIKIYEVGHVKLVDGKFSA